MNMKTPKDQKIFADKKFEDLEKRIRVLEERFAFYEYGNETLSSVEFELEKRIQKLERENQQLIEEIRRLRACLRDPFNPQPEKPPHY